MIKDLLKQSTLEINQLLSDDILKSFEIFTKELNKWNSKMNLTAIFNENEIAIKHYLDSLQMAKYLSDKDSLLDIGSGAGFPVIPLKIVKPETLMISVDSVARKINFQRHVIRVLKLKGIEALQARAEDLHKIYSRKFSIITSRAFSKLNHFVSLAAPLLDNGGRLIAMKGADVNNEIAECKDILRQHSIVVTAINEYDLPSNMGKRSLIVMMHCEHA